MKHLLFALLTLLICSSSYAEEEKKAVFLKSGSTPLPTKSKKMTAATCGRVDLTSGLGPVHNQTGGTCYAYAALDLLNFGLNRRYSALHLASLKKIEVSTPDPNAKKCPGSSNNSTSKLAVLNEIGGFNAGHIQEAIKLGMEKGLCPEEKVPSTAGLSKDYDGFLEYYRTIRSKAELCDPVTGKTISEMSLLQAVARQARERFDGWKTESVMREVSRIFPTVSSGKVKEVADNSTSPDDLIKKLNDESCRPFMDTGIPQGKTATNVIDHGMVWVSNCKKYYHKEDQMASFDLINRSLDNGRPAGVSYVTGGLVKPVGTKVHGFHASVVAGRTWDESEKSCFYLVKNSWGTDWKVPAGLKAKSSRDYPGYFMVSEKHLMEHMYGATAID